MNEFLVVLAKMDALGVRSNRQLIVMLILWSGKEMRYAEIFEKASRYMHINTLQMPPLLDKGLVIRESKTVDGERHSYYRLSNKAMKMVNATLK